MRKKSIRKNYGVDPELKREGMEKYGDVFDFSGAPDEMKMSAKLIALTEPYHDEDADYPLLYDCATIAWNQCLKEDFDIATKYILNNILINFAKHGELIDALKRRKRQLYPEVMQGVRRVKVTDQGNGDLNISVLSDMSTKAFLERLRRLGELELEDV